MKNLRIIGWDIGGANIKATRIVFDNGNIKETKSISRYFEMWNFKNKLAFILKQIYQEIGLADYMAITMTAELADCFYSKEEGVKFITKIVKKVFPDLPLYFLTNNCKYVKTDRVKNKINQVAAANWVASGLLVADYYSNVVFCDIGSTTTDIIPIVNKKIQSSGKTDQQRLVSGELLYIGYLRTNIASFIEKIPYQGNWVRVMKEYFSSTADLHLFLDLIKQDNYKIPTADNRKKTRRDAGNRIARLIGLDNASLTNYDLQSICKYILEKELYLLQDGLFQVYSRVSPDFTIPLFVTGNGAFLFKIIASRLNIKYLDNEKIPVLNNNIITSLGTAYGLYRWIT